MNPRNGDIFRMASFTHVVPDARLTYKTADKNRVAVFMLLGQENKDCADPLDCEKRLNELGWIKDPALLPPAHPHPAEDTGGGK